MIGVILLGESNSGKSTIGREVAKKLNMRYISSGDIARKMSEDVQEQLNNGKLAPEQEMREAILKSINNDTTPFMLDGFPRFYDQYEWINQSVGCEFVYIIIDVPRDDIISRATSRGREDDNAIFEKIKFYDENTRPMIEEMIINENENIYCINNPNNADISNGIELLYNILEGYINAHNNEI